MKVKLFSGRIQSRVEDSCIIVSGARIMPVDRESRLDISQDKATPSSSSLEVRHLLLMQRLITD